MSKKKLIIVESPNKIKKIKSFLDSNWDVIASVGHIRDLKIYGTRLNLGVDLETMEPFYINIKKKEEVINELIEHASNADEIYLATDPDREGEAIALHIKDVIKESLDHKAPTFKRIIFNEITNKAVLNSINHPTRLNMKLVESQEARRILDRMIGFRLSALSRKKVHAPSAGRVKSVVLKIIIDREEEISKFVPEYWWTIIGEVKKDWELLSIDDEYKEKHYKTDIEAENVINNLSGSFEYVETKTIHKTIPSPKPLEMATYLMGMYSKYGMANYAATIAAQSLYEKGVITYPRTDSLRISSEEFLVSIKKEITSLYGEDYFEPLKEFKASKQSQDAHEAMRPTEIHKSPDTIKDLKINEKKAYRFIWETTMKSMMKPGKNLSLREIYKDNNNLFLIRRSLVVEPGFRKIDGIKANDIEKEMSHSKNLKIKSDILEIKENSTSPPPRYNQASIIKKMKEEGIGRPSTYSATTFGLIQFNYLDKVNGALVPTDLAVELNDLLIKKAKFNDIVNVEYTSDMEKSLDLIAHGEVNQKEFLSKFWDKFEHRVEDALESIAVKPFEKVGRKCPDCKEGDLIKRNGRFGMFISCNKFPECKHSEPLVKKPKPIEIKSKEYGVCPECEKTLIARDSRYGKKFIGCSGYPDCHFIMQKEKTQEILLDMGVIKKEDIEPKKKPKVKKK